MEMLHWASPRSGSRMDILFPSSSACPNPGSEEKHWDFRLRLQGCFLLDWCFRVLGSRVVFLSGGEVSS